MTGRSRPAGRSHPPTLITRTRRTLREETPLARGERVLVAVSGGGDSIALLHVLSCIAPKLEIELAAHGVDHGLRPDAAKELDLAEQLAARLGIHFTRSRIALAPGGNLQARARAARHQALDEAAERARANWVATAHHADDRAETVLMRILRGTRPQGLAVLPAVSERRLRPLIRSPKSAIDAHLARHHLVYADDPSNRDPRFFRSRIRHELMPLLRALAPAVVDQLNHLADECAETEPVVVTDAQGRRMSLLRSQATQIRRARKLNRKNVRIWLPGGRELAPHESGVARGPEAGERASESPGTVGPKPPRPQNTEGRGAKPTKSD